MGIPEVNILCWASPSLFAIARTKHITRCVSGRRCLQEFKAELAFVHQLGGYLVAAAHRLVRHLQHSQRAGSDSDDALLETLTRAHLQLLRHTDVEGITV